jgi:tRNA(fMet)-specific endonuclease VapC
LSGFRYLLDTNVFIHARQRRDPVVRRFASLRRGEAAQSVVTYGELLYGARKSSNEADALRRIEEAATMIPVLPLTKEAAEVYSALRAELSRRGEIIGSNDLWIAAHALSAGLILVTNNTGEFGRISTLAIENWATS